MVHPAFLQKLITANAIKLASSLDRYPLQHRAGESGLPLLVIENELGRAVIALQGAHVLEYRPIGEREMLWISPRCVFQSGNPIRGGIPLCLPWFGSIANGTSMHGFARTREWSLVEAQNMASGATRLAFELKGEASSSALWPHAFAFRLDVLVGRELVLNITVVNHSDTVAPIAFAFHTYFAVSNLSRVSVSGLDGIYFIDKTDNFNRKQQQGDVIINGVTNNIYIDVPTRQTLTMTTADVRIESDTQCAVVWNIGTNDTNVQDIGEGNHVGYLCVERGDISDRAVALSPGEKYQRGMTLSNSLT